MIKDGHDFLEWLHQIREEHARENEKMTDKEVVAKIQAEARTLRGCARRLHVSSDGGGGGV